MLSPGMGNISLIKIVVQLFEASAYRIISSWFWSHVTSLHPASLQPTNPQPSAGRIDFQSSAALAAIYQ